MTDWPSTVRSTLTGRTVATSSFTTNTNEPAWLSCSAVAGMTTRLSVAQRQLGVDQRARPQDLFRVRHGGAEGHHAGRGIDRVIDTS